MAYDDTIDTHKLHDLQHCIREETLVNNFLPRVAKTLALSKKKVSQYNVIGVQTWVEYYIFSHFPCETILFSTY